MRIQTKVALLVAVAWAIMGTACQAQSYSKKLFNGTWKFIQQDVTLGQTHSVDEWRSVELPHDWSIEGEFSQDNPMEQGGWLPAGIGWYVQEFSYKPDRKRPRVFLEFDGVMANSTVYVNDHEVGHRPSGYATFCYDVSDYMHKGENRIAVKVDNSVQPAARWYTGSGITHNVRLVEKAEVYIPYQGIFTYTQDGFQHVQVEICNVSDKPQTVTLKAGMNGKSDGKGNATAWVQKEYTVAPGGKEVAEISLPVEGLDRWSPDNAVLHDLQICLSQGDKVIQREQFRIGIRDIRYDNQTGFWLNGQNMKMYGVCLHSDAGALGGVFDYDVWEYRLLKLKDIGANAIRFAHNAPARELLNMCDEMGFLVMVESFDTWEAAKPHAEKGYNLHFNEWWKPDTEDMVKNARNHPSVVIYSVGNEIRDNLNNEDGFRKYRQQQDLIHEIDPTRPVTMALFRPNSSGVYRNGFAEMMDITGQNYRIEELKAYHEAHPEKAIIGTENTHDRESWLMLRDDPSLCGQFLWTGVEYLGEAEWPQVSWNTALLDITGQIKPLGLQRKSWWSKLPMVAFARREGQELVLDWTPIDPDARTQYVEVYSNCQEVELFLNGRSLGRKSMDPDARPAIYNIGYEPGTLLAKGYNDGVIEAYWEVRTAGEPYALALEREGRGIYRAYVVDKDGTVCPNANVPVTFANMFRVTDNGNPNDHTNHQNLTRMTWHGTCIGILKRRFPLINSSFSQLTVTAPGLKPSSDEDASARGNNGTAYGTVHSKDAVWNWKHENRAGWMQNMAQQSIRQNDLEMKFSYQIFGEKPEGGRSMYISMHGGGNTAHSVNDSQWENQKRLYQPEEGVYVCPRAPWDDWDMWFKAPIGNMLEELIQTMISELDVNPNRVYLMGYSAGGDGVWRLAPRLADHFAAAAMMAGHPGDVHLENVRNMPFTIWVGGQDAAYNRNKEVAARGVELDSLRANSFRMNDVTGPGYIHETHVLEDKPHWMDLEDAAAVKWMSQFERNPYPDRIVWRQEEVTREYFYWLGVPSDELERGKTIIVSRKGNTFYLERCDYSRFYIYYNDRMIDQSKPVKVKYKGRNLLNKAHNYVSPIHQSANLKLRGDANYAFDHRILIENF